MCGRFTLRASPVELMQFFRLASPPAVAPRYNIAPTQQIGCVIHSVEGHEWVSAHWGIVPAWQRSSGTVRPLINARAESVHQKPSFRESFRRRRCLVPFDGFFEWQTTGTASRKQPWLIRVSGTGVAVFAALYDHIPGADGQTRVSCCLLTTEANSLVAGIHDRMPVILDRADQELWMTGEVSDVLPLLRPYPAELMERVTVGFAVGNARNDTADCIMPTSEPLRGSLLTGAGMPQSTHPPGGPESHAAL